MSASSTVRQAGASAKRAGRYGANQSGEMMKISRVAVERLLKIDWMKNVGTPTSLLNVKQIYDEKEFINEITSVKWENATLEAGNDITGNLARKQIHAYQSWNELVREAKLITQKEIIQLIKMEKLDEKVLLDNFMWDIVNYLMEDAYGNYLKGPLFFDSLIKVYEGGHIPCGWDGIWPVGRLVIY